MLAAVTAAIVITAPVRLHKAHRFVKTDRWIAVAHLKMDSACTSILCVLDEMLDQTLSDPPALRLGADRKKQQFGIVDDRPVKREAD